MPVVVATIVSDADAYAGEVMAALRLWESDFQSFVSGSASWHAGLTGVIEGASVYYPAG